MQLDPRKLEIPSRSTYKLDQMIAATESLKNPQFGRRTIIVAGTNGKGSTCALLTQLFLSQKIKVGTFISPHVMRRTERISINGKNISEFILKKYEKKYALVLKPLTFFERYTLLAFLIFRDQKVDLQILEVGMGGRLDATNIAHPDISVITRIDYDHQEILGKTLTLIAREKAGIMRSEGLAVLGIQRPAVLKSLKKEAEELHSSLVDISKEKISKSLKQQLKQIEKEKGSHQKDNAWLALTVFEKASQLWGFKKYRIPSLKSLFQYLPPGRIQILRKNPLWIVDGSHNENSLDALRQYLKNHYAHTRFDIIFGVMADKNINSMIKKLRPWIGQMHLPSFYPEREMKPEILQKILSAKKIKSSVVENLNDFVSHSWKSKKPVLVVGSLYLAGAVLLEIKN